MKMKVYVLSGYVDYEGDTILGVYLNDYEGVQAKENYVIENPNNSFDGFKLEQRIVGSPADWHLDHKYYEYI